MLKILKKIFKRNKRKELYDYLSEEDKVMYEKINRGIPAGDLAETLAFLNRIEEIKKREGIK